MHGLVISALKMGTLNTLLSIMQMAAGMMIKYQGQESRTKRYQQVIAPWAARQRKQKGR